jgi:Dyp-type peroxidase family
MPITLTEPLTWETASGDDATMLESLQANIVKGHVRDHLTMLFLRFDDAAEGATFLHEVGALAKSAKRHLEETQAFKAGQPLTGVRSYVGVGITATGYAALGAAATPGDISFAGGMKASRQSLADPPVSTWDEGYRGEVHAVVLVGDAEDALVRQAKTVQKVLDLVTDAVAVVARETGRSLLNANGHGIEHFGYVDGRSQPLFLTEDVAEETQGGDGATVWDPAFPLGQLVVPDPAAPDPGVHFGSYFVYRKLEQNVALFKQSERDLATKLDLPDPERAGAMLVGRFEDGTPLTVQSAPGAHSPLMNDFDYDSDAAGSKCPHVAHIRTTNPRGSGGSPNGDPTDVAFERSHIMARRGQTYGHRTDDPNGDVDPEERPTGDVGLLFMAFNADLGSQFEFTQRAWANNPDFPFSSPEQPVGLDPVIGQGSRDTSMPCPVGWGAGGGANIVQAEQVPQAVTMKGGEYFFMPSLPFLAALGGSA